MSMIPCPGCGLPREEAQVGVAPCPVCDAAPLPAAAPPRATKPATPDPTANLPADVSQLHAAAATASDKARLLGWFVVFALGVGVGVGGLLGWRVAFPPQPVANHAAAPAPEYAPSSATAIALAPMPRESLPRSPEPPPSPTPELPPEPKPEPKPATPPGHAIVVELNQPDATYTVPFSMKKGEHVVLRGKVKTLRVKGMDGGAVLDASALEVENVFVSGQIDGRSRVKIHAPRGVVQFSSVKGKSSIEVDAPGGAVKCSATIDGGATVAITAARVDLRGEVNGIETRVEVKIPGDGSLKVSAVRGIATVEYRVEGDGMPEIVASTVSATATFRRVE